MAANGPPPFSNAGGSSDFSKSAEALTKSLQTLEKSASSVSTVLGGAAFVGVFKKVIPDATNKIVAALVSNVGKLNSTMSGGVNQLRSAFRNLFLVMRTGVEQIQSLFAVHNVRLSSTSKSTGGVKEISAGTGSLKPMAAPGGGPGYAPPNALPINGEISHILAPLLTQIATVIEKLGSRISADFSLLNEVIRRKGDSIEGTFENASNTIETLLNGVANSLTAAVGHLARITNPNSINVHVHDDMGIASLKEAQAKAGGKSGGGLGIGALVKGIGIFSFALTAFGAALNPGAIVQLGMAFRDVAATIGVAFEPAIHVVTEGMRQVAAQILPLFVSLRPVITQLVQSFVRMLAPAARIAANYLMMVVPVLQILTSILDGFTTVWTYMSTVFITFQDMLLEFISSLLGNVGFGDAMNNVTKTLQYVGQQLILVIASIAKKLGASGFLGGLIKNFQNLITAPKTGGATAGGETSTKSLESIVKSMAESAGKAGGYAGPSPEDQQKERDEERKRLAEETLTALKEIQKKGETDTLLPELLDLVKMVVQGINGSKDAINWIKDFFKNFAKNPKTSFDQGYNASKSGKKTRVAGDSLVDELIADLGYSAGKVF